MCSRSVVCFVFLGLLLGQLPASAGSENGKRVHDQIAFGVKMAGRGLWNEALFRFKQAEKSQPGNPRVLNNLAVSYEAVGQFDEALGYYKRALKADSSSREVKRNYSRFVEFYQAFKPDEDDPKKSGTEVSGPEESEDPATTAQPAAPDVSQEVSPGEESG